MKIRSGFKSKSKMSRSKLFHYKSVDSHRIDIYNIVIKSIILVIISIYWPKLECSIWKCLILLCLVRRAIKVSRLRNGPSGKTSPLHDSPSIAPKSIFIYFIRQIIHPNLNTKNYAKSLTDVRWKNKERVTFVTWSWSMHVTLSTSHPIFYNDLCFFCLFN